MMRLTTCSLFSASKVYSSVLKWDAGPELSDFVQSLRLPYLLRKSLSLLVSLCKMLEHKFVKLKCLTTDYSSYIYTCMVIIRHWQSPQGVDHNNHIDECYDLVRLVRATVGVGVKSSSNSTPQTPPSLCPSPLSFSFFKKFTSTWKVEIPHHEKPIFTLCPLAPPQNRHVTSPSTSPSTAQPTFQNSKIHIPQKVSPHTETEAHTKISSP